VPVTAPPTASTVPVTAITATESGQRALFARRRRPPGQRLSPGRAGGTKSTGEAKRTSRGPWVRLVLNVTQVVLVNCRICCTSSRREGALVSSSPSRLTLPSPFLDRLPVLTERIEPVFHVHSGHGREHVANHAGLLDCRLRVGYHLAGQRAFRIRPALPSVRTAAALRDAAQRVIRARPAQLASAIKRPGPGRRGPLLANPPWRGMTQRRPGCRRPACAQGLTRCSQGRSVAR
jgi:hypothetical protein